MNQDSIPMNQSSKCTKTPELSVITPVYGCERYFSVMLSSLSDQTFQNWEGILVDDGSPDRCGEIADEAARLDGRFRVIHQRNAGPIAARNRALNSRRATKAFAFFDFDDVLAPETYQVAMDALCKTGAGFAEFPYVKFDENEQPPPIEDPPNVEVLDREEWISKAYFSDLTKCNGWVYCDKVFRMDLFGDMRCMPSVITADDTIFCFTALSRWTKMVRIQGPKIAMLRRLRTTSITQGGARVFELLSPQWHAQQELLLKGCETIGERFYFHLMRSLWTDWKRASRLERMALRSVVEVSLWQKYIGVKYPLYFWLWRRFGWSGGLRKIKTRILKGVK